MSFYPSVVENIANYALTRPDTLALADSNLTLTYAELNDRINALAHTLMSKGIREGDCVTVECNQSVDYIVSEMAIQLIGGIFVPIERNAAFSRIEEIVTDTESKLLIGKAPVEGIDIDFLKISEASAQTPCSFEDLHLDGYPAGSRESEILFSTGTTGKSKGIVLTNSNNIAIAENIINGVEMKDGNVELIPMPLSHSHGLRTTYANLTMGCTSVFIDGVTLLKKVFNMMDQFKVTSMDLSPSMLSIIFKLSKDRIGDYADTLDYIQLGSAPLSEEDKVHLSRVLPKTRLYNFYGSTEAGRSCCLDFNKSAGKVGCIGKPSVNARFIVVDDNRNEIKSSRDNLGLLASAGPINMKCYFKEPELTAETMSNGFIYTKDLGFIDDEGYVYMLGRKDDVINYGGIKISPEEIESQVLKSDIVADCACIPVTDALMGQAPKLYVQLESGAEYDQKTFKTFLADVLDANKLPKYIELIDAIPRTSNGKIIRKDLAAMNK